MADLPSGTVTLLFTDIEGSTARWEQHGGVAGTEGRAMTVKQPDA